MNAVSNRWLAGYAPFGQRRFSSLFGLLFAYGSKPWVSLNLSLGPIRREDIVLGRVASAVLRCFADSIRGRCVCFYVKQSHLRITFLIIVSLIEWSALRRGQRPILTTTVTSAYNVQAFDSIDLSQAFDSIDLLQAFDSICLAYSFIIEPIGKRKNSNPILNNHDFIKCMHRYSECTTSRVSSPLLYSCR